MMKKRLYQIIALFLPIFNKGEIVHLHDIELVYKYNKTNFTNPVSRVFWAEPYLLQAFLACIKAFEVILPLCHLQKNCKKEFDEVFPLGKDVSFWGSGRFWIRRVNQWMTLIP